jgi:flagellar biosynthesis protein FlhG
MKPLDEQNYYELLEISRNASRDEVERAYRLACSTYSSDSMAGLAVFGDGDVEVIRARLDAAYEVLRNDDARAAFDADLEKESGAVESLVPANEELAHSSSTLEDLDDQGGEFDGPRLRRLRMHRGVELDDIANTTKVNPTYLQFIEEERFADLPAAVYVRGFVMGYASSVGLDPRQVADSYMGRYEESHNNPRRRLFGRS